MKHLRKFFGSQKTIWLVIVLLGFLYFDLNNSISDYNKRLDEFNTDSYRESIKKVVQEDIDKSFKKFQADLDKSTVNYQSSIDTSDLDTKINNFIRYSEGKLDSRITILESENKYLQQQVGFLRVDVLNLKNK